MSEPGSRCPRSAATTRTGTRGLVHVDPTGPATIVDGGAEGLADMAAFGAAVERADPLRGRSVAGGAPRAGRPRRADRRHRLKPPPRVPAPVRPAESRPTLGANQTLRSTLRRSTRSSARAPTARPFRAPGSAPWCTAPPRPAGCSSPSTRRSPPSTARCRPHGSPTVTCPSTTAGSRSRSTARATCPMSTSTRSATRTGSSSRSTSTASPQRSGSGWTRVPVNLHHVSTLRVTIDQGPTAEGRPRRPRRVSRRSGFPASTSRQLLRPPVITARALAGTDLSHDSLRYVFERTTGDDPFKRNPYGTTTLLDSPQDRGDAEQYIERLIFAPAARSYTASAWVYPAVTPRTRRWTGSPGCAAPTPSIPPAASRTSPPTVPRAHSAPRAARAGSPSTSPARHPTHGSAGPRASR